MHSSLQTTSISIFTLRLIDQEYPFNTFNVIFFFKYFKIFLQFLVKTDRSFWRKVKHVLPWVSFVVLLKDIHLVFSKNIQLMSSNYVAVYWLLILGVLMVTHFVYTLFWNTDIPVNIKHSKYDLLRSSKQNGTKYAYMSVLKAWDF